MCVCVYTYIDSYWNSDFRFSSVSVDSISVNNESIKWKITRIFLLVVIFHSSLTLAHTVREAVIKIVTFLSLLFDNRATILNQLNTHAQPYNDEPT